MNRKYLRCAEVYSEPWEGPLTYVYPVSLARGYQFTVKYYKFLNYIDYVGNILIPEMSEF